MVLYAGSHYTTIDYPRAVSTWAWDVNDAGLIVGTYAGSNGVSHGFLYRKGKFTAINFPTPMAPPSTVSIPVGISSVLTPRRGPYKMDFF